MYHNGTKCFATEMEDQLIVNSLGLRYVVPIVVNELGEMKIVDICQNVHHVDDCGPDDIYWPERERESRGMFKLQIAMLLNQNRFYECYKVTSEMNTRELGKIGVQKKQNKTYIIVEKPESSRFQRQPCTKEPTQSGHLFIIA